MESNNQFQKSNDRNLQPSKWPILSNWLVIIFLVIWYPVGVIIMWLFTRWNKKAKIFVTIMPFLIIVILSFIIIFSLRQESKKLKEKATEHDNIINLQTIELADQGLKQNLIRNYFPA